MHRIRVAMNIHNAYVSIIVMDKSDIIITLHL